MTGAPQDLAGKVLGGFMLITVLMTVATCGARAIGNAVNPEAAVQRRAAHEAKLEAGRAEARLRVERATAERLAEGRAAEARREKSIAAQAAEDRAALERYAECQIRNRTPGYCTEDWEPTEEIKTMNEIAREGRF